MAKYTIEDTTLTAIADAIRDKTGTTDAVSVLEMAATIGSITGGGGGGGGPELHAVTKNCDNASTVVEYFRALRPSGCNDMIVALKVPDGITALSNFENGQMLCLVLNGTKAGYARWYSSAVNVQTTFTTSYTCKSFAGDEYYLIPLV